MTFEFTYSKQAFNELYEGLQDQSLNMVDCRPYIPIYNLFFNNLTERNSQYVSFNYDISIKKVLQVEDSNSLVALCRKSKEAKDGSGQTITEQIEMKLPVFIKYGPLLDPVRYLVGKYDMSDNLLKTIPFSPNDECNKKIGDYDNSSYIDAFFSFLSSKLLHNHSFLNSIDCYGSLLGYKSKFDVDITDDFEYLTSSDFFLKNQGVIYELDTEHSKLVNHDSRSRKQKLEFGEDISNELDITSIDNTELDELFELKDNYEVKYELGNLGDLQEYVDLSHAVMKQSRKNTAKSSTCSSRTSLTNTSTENDEKEDMDVDAEDTNDADRDADDMDSDNDDNRDEHSNNNSDDEDDDDDDEDNSDEEEDEEEDDIIAKIYDFPVQAMFLEKCEETLDSLCENDEDFGSDELNDALLQVVMTLITYKRCFDFQHNDLHTNNVMYIPTDKQYLYYKVDGKYYKVPTHGRIFKIIDFGRATYKFRGNQFCSDSFHEDGDAHTQFNFGRHYNDKKPLLEPNDSFDLCRLGCSLLDFVVEDMEELPDVKDPVIKMIAEWCCDDQGRNLLWKSNGDERYPGFKLYKMIARSVTKHTPISQLERKNFAKHRLPKKAIRKGVKIFDIDSLPCYI